MAGTDDKSDPVQHWIGKINKEEKAHQKWCKQADEAEREYFDDLSNGLDELFNLFKSTVDTLGARLFSATPVPDVRRRYDFEGPMGKAAKDAAKMVERGLSFSIDTSPFYTNADQAVGDFLRAGAGIPWVKYDPKVKLNEKGEPAEIQRQDVKLTHVPWKRFHWEPAKSWEHVDWVAFDEYLTKEEIAKAYDGKAPSQEGKSASDGRTESDKYQQTYRVTEIWYKPTRTVYVLGWEFDELLEVRKDALNLQDFYPCPRPMFANVRSNELTPTPDHRFNRKAYEYVNRLVQRIHSITKEIKAAGFYDAQLTELSQLAAVDDGTYLPISNLAERLAATGITDFNKVMATLPMTEKVTVVRELQTLLDAEKYRLDEANGISDIVRGTTDPNETATAQTIKGNWASLRLSKKQGEVSRCFRDVFRIMAEIMAEHYTPESWFLATGMQAAPEVMQVLKSDMGRSLAIDVETDSTVAMEDEAEKAQRLEFLNYVSPFIQQVLPAMAQGMLPADVGKELLKFALQSFKHGRQLEDAIEAAPGTAQQMQQMQQQSQQAQQGMEQAQTQAQQLQQALQQCQEALQKLQMEQQSGKMQIEQDKLALDRRRLEIEENQAASDLLNSQEKHGSEMGERQSEADISTGIMETLATIQQTAVMSQQATMSGIEQMGQTLMIGLQGIADAQSQPKETVIQRDKAGNIVGAVSVGVGNGA